MIIFDVLSYDSPVGDKGDKLKKQLFSISFNSMLFSFLRKIGMKKGRPPVKVKRPFANGVNTVYIKLQLVQYFSYVRIDTDGVFLNLLGRICLVQIDTGINCVRPLICHPPETKFHYARRIHAGA